LANMESREELIVSEIKRNPGSRFREVMEKINLSNGVLSYYVRKLENNGVIKTQRTTRVSRFFINDMTEEESKVASRLRQTTPKAILVSLLENDRMEFQEIVSSVGKASATVSFYLSKLVNDGIVDFKKSNLKKRYFVVEKQRIANLITEYHPDVVETASDNLADIMSSL
jgi:predicted transcriptional regulator